MSDLEDRMEALAQAIVSREALHRDEISRARESASSLHARVSAAIDRFNQVVSAELPHFEILVSPPRVDDKHLHAIEFDLERGRHRAIITIKSKGEVTLVGPFRFGKNEGPCRTFPIDAEDEIEPALADFLERFLQEAATP